MDFPIKPIFLLADSQLLFSRDNDPPFLERVKGCLADQEIKAAYIGASNDDNPDFFSIFEAAMDNIGVTNPRMILSSYGEEDQEYLKEANLILLAGGDVAKGWKIIDETGMAKDLIQRYYGGAVLIGVSAGAVQLGLKGAKTEEPHSDEDLVETFKLIPFLVDAHDENNRWTRLKKMVRAADSYTKGLAIPSGGGLIYHEDHTIEPVRKPLTEFARTEDRKEITETLLLPPEKGSDGAEMIQEPAKKKAAEPGADSGAKRSKKPANKKKAAESGAGSGAKRSKKPANKKKAKTAKAREPLTDKELPVFQAEIIR